MAVKSVAVIDIRSSRITAAVAERGVNNTFIIKSRCEREYDGYAEGEFLDLKSFSDALNGVIADTLSAVNKPFKKIYIGVPGEFTKVVCTEKTLSFMSAKRIKNKDLRYAEKLSRPADDTDYVNVNSGCIYYVLSDKRRMIDPIGEVSDSLQAKLCFYMAKRDFMRITESALETSGFKCLLEYVPSVQAEALYLIAPEKRDECAVLFDFGYISSTFSVICGNGVLYSESFSIGVGHLAYLLSDSLGIPYDAAYDCLQRANLNAKDKGDDKAEYKNGGDTYTLSISALRDNIRLGIDGVCEMIEECIHGYGGSLDGKTLLLTGDGANIIRGMGEHIASRMERNVEVTAPPVPYYDKPQLSSLLSLTDFALDDAENSSLFKRFSV